MTDQHYSQDYWEAFYSHAEDRLTSAPSPFALEVANTLSGSELLVELGAGSGRDFHLLRRRSGHAIATDASHEAVKLIRRALEADQTDDATAEIFDVESREDREQTTGILSEWRTRITGPLVLYARFFLHAIPSEAESHLIEWAHGVLKDGEVFHLEYRAADLEGEYVFGTHYRRPVLPQEVEKLATSMGFTDASSRLSADFAPYGSERPLVARTVLVR